MAGGVHWIDAQLGGRLAIMPRPRAGEWLDDEVARWKAQNISLVVSLLEPSEISELELEREAELCRTSGIEFMSFPIPDRGVPHSLSQAKDLVQRLAERILAGDAIAIHCRAGIGRSATIAACILGTRGIQGEAAMRLIAEARGVLVPDTDAQRTWVDEFNRAL